MNLEDIEKLWLEDCKIDETNLLGASSDIPKLHSKYFQIYNRVGLKLKKQRQDHKVLVKLKTEYYNGSIDENDLREQGWKPNPLKILRQDVPTYVESDKDVITSTLRVSYTEQTVKFLEDIIKQINNRNFIVKNMIDWSKFTNGGY